MPSITLRKGSATGPETVFSLGFINLDDLVAGTDYYLESEGEITLGIGGTLKVGNIRLAGNGFDALDLSSASDLIERPRWIHDSVSSPDRYLPAGVFVPETVGVQPDDWELRWRDKYYTLVTRSQGGHDIYTYMPLSSDTWSDSTQYYSNETCSALYWTPNSGFFGVRTFYTSTSTNKTAVVCAGSSQTYNYTNQINNSPISCQLKNIGGTPVCMKTDSVQHNWRPYRTEQSTYSTTGTARLRAVLVLVQLDGKNWPALAVIGYAVDESINYVGMWYADSRFWTNDDIQPGTPGNWGANSNAIKPSRENATFVSVGVNTSFPTALNAASYGTAAGGVNVWAMDENDFGALNGFLWEESFINRITHLGRSPGDGIIAVHGMPEVSDYAPSASVLRMYGIPTTLTAHKISKRVMFVDLGTVKVPPVTGIYSDYAAKIEIYLPFCGTYSLDPQKVMRSTLHLVYGFDRFTGDCVAQLEASTAYPAGVDPGTHPTGTTLVLTAQGNAAVSLPYAYTDGGVQGKLTALSGALTAGLAAASGSTGGILSGAMQMMQGLGQSQHISASAATGNSGAMSPMEPFIWVEYPEPLEPANYGKTVGYMSGVGGTVSEPQFDNIGDAASYAGLQIFDAVDIDSIPCTREEAQEIETLLKGGVFL